MPYPQIGITERGDAALDLGWKPWVRTGNPAILITKDPTKLLTELDKDRANGQPRPNVIVHCTITGLGGTIYEPNVPQAGHALLGYKQLIQDLGANRVVLRVDPIMPTPSEFNLALRVIKWAKDTNPSGRIRISFLDNYDHVKRRFQDAGLCPLPYDFHAGADVRAWCLWRIKTLTDGQVEICGEPNLSGTMPCVSTLDCKTLGIQISPNMDFKRQRKECHCLACKHELLGRRNRCAHECLYCYWKD